MNDSIWTKVKEFAEESTELNEYLDKVRTIINFDNLSYDEKGTQHGRKKKISDD